MGIVAGESFAVGTTGECRRDRGYDGAGLYFHCEKPTELAMPRKKGKVRGEPFCRLRGALRVGRPSPFRGHAQFRAKR